MNTTKTIIDDDSTSYQSNATVEIETEDMKFEQIEADEEEDEEMEELQSGHHATVWSVTQPQSIGSMCSRTAISASQVYGTMNGMCSSTPMTANKRATQTKEYQKNGMLMHLY